MNLSFIISCFLFVDWEVDASITSLDMIPVRDRLHFAYITKFLVSFDKRWWCPLASVF